MRRDTANKWLDNCQSVWLRLYWTSISLLTEHECLRNIHLVNTTNIISGWILTVEDLAARKSLSSLLGKNKLSPLVFVFIYSSNSFLSFNYLEHWSKFTSFLQQDPQLCQLPKKKKQTLKILPNFIILCPKLHYNMETIRNITTFNSTQKGY